MIYMVVTQSQQLLGYVLFFYENIYGLIKQG